MEESFLQELRRTLNHLYDPPYLVDSQLCAALGVTGSHERAIRLQRLLEQAITALKPQASQPGNQKAWQHYKYLAYRHLQQFPQKEVADQLGVSETQLYRLQKSALEALASYLWEKYDTGSRWPPDMVPAARDAAPEAPADMAETLRWLTSDSTQRLSYLTRELDEVAVLLGPVLEQRQVLLDLQLDEYAPPLRVHPVALRQVLLVLLHHMIGKVSGGRIRLSVADATEWVKVELIGEARELVSDEEVETAIEPAQQLIELYGGALVVMRSEKDIRFSFTLPGVRRTAVVVIDDNADHLGLLQRFVTNTRYEIFATPDPQEGLDLAAKVGAQAIVLDIMMPKIDGWAVLQALRSHPVLHRIPVLICSILPMASLAATLTAEAFLQKPVSREQFLAALDQRTAVPAKARELPPG